MVSKNIFIASAILALMSVAYADPLPLYTLISSGYQQVQDPVSYAWSVQPYCSLSSVVLALLQDPTLWVTNFTCTDNGDGSWSFGSASPWLKKKDQIPPTKLYGTFGSLITGDQIFTLESSSQWANYTELVNAFAASMQANALPNTPVESFNTFAYTQASDMPDFDFAVPAANDTAAIESIIETAEYEYYGTLSPVRQYNLLLQLESWSIANEIVPLIFNPVITSLETVDETIIKNEHVQATMGMTLRRN